MSKASREFKEHGYYGNWSFSQYSKRRRTLSKYRMMVRRWKAMERKSNRSFHDMVSTITPTEIREYVGA